MLKWYTPNKKLLSFFNTCETSLDRSFIKKLCDHLWYFLPLHLLVLFEITLLLMFLCFISKLVFFTKSVTPGILFSISVVFGTLSVFLTEPVVLGILLLISVMFVS